MMYMLLLLFPPKLLLFIFSVNTAEGKELIDMCGLAESDVDELYSTISSLTTG